jgi:hypothetical protein
MSRILVGFVVALVLIASWGEITLIQNSQMLKKSFPQSFQGRKAAWTPVIVYYCRPLFGLSNRAYFDAGLKLDFETKSKIGYGAGVLGPVVWRYFTRHEVDSLIRLP